MSSAVFRMSVTYPTAAGTIVAVVEAEAVEPENAVAMFRFEEPTGLIVTLPEVPGAAVTAVMVAPLIVTASWTFFHDTCSAESAAMVKRMTGVSVAPRVAPAEATVMVGFVL